MALVTAQPPPPVALAPLLRGLLSVSKLSLGSGTAKSQRSGRCLPHPFPQRQPALGGRKERGQRNNNPRVQVPQGPPAKEKRHSVRGRNGAFNVQTQPVYHFPGKNQTSVEFPHTLTVLSGFSWTREGNGLQRKPRNIRISIPHSTHTKEIVTTRPTRGLWWPSWCTMVHWLCQPAKMVAITAPNGQRKTL